MLAIPLRENEKRPLEKDWPNKLYPLEELSDWRGNIGLPTGEPNNVMALDFDDKEAARQFYRKHKDIIRTINVTKRGAHFLFEGSGPTRKFEHGDIKGDGGYIVIPKSQVNGFTYWFPEGHGLQELCPFPEELFLTPSTSKIITRNIKDVRAYLSKVESIQGRSGSRGLVRAAAICRDAGLSASEATIELLEWNDGPTVCPKWDHADIARAVTRTYTKG